MGRTVRAAFSAVSARLTASAASSCQTRPWRHRRQPDPQTVQPGQQNRRQRRPAGQQRLRSQQRRLPPVQPQERSQPQERQEEELQQCLRIPASRRPSASARQQVRQEQVWCSSIGTPREARVVWIGRRPHRIVPRPVPAAAEDKFYMKARYDGKLRQGLSPRNDSSTALQVNRG
jgi:hypothetical protein